MNDRELLNAYGVITSGAPVGPMRRTEPCACGEDITAEVGWEAAAIDEHNARPCHQAWRAWRAAQGYGPLDTPLEYATATLADRQTPPIIRVLSQPNIEGA